MFWQGFQTGFVVGSIFGGVMGVVSAVQYRTFYFFPVAAISSGCSFGFFMGLGMLIRSEMEEKSDLESVK